MKTQLSLTQKILAGVITCTLLIIAVAWYSFNNNRRYVESNEMVEHTYKVMREFRIIEKLTIDAETGARGYILSGQNEFLEPYRNTDSEINEHLLIARQLARDNPAQLVTVESLHRRILDHFNFLNKCISLKNLNPHEAIQMISSGQGKRIEDGIRAEVEYAQNVEQALLDKRKADNEEYARSFKLVFTVLVITIILVLIVMYYIIASNLRALRKSQSEAAERNWMLSGNAGLNEVMQGEKDTLELGQQMIAFLTQYLEASAGALYIEEDGQLKLSGSFAWAASTEQKIIKHGEGLVGQAAVAGKPVRLSNVPHNYFRISSALGNALPKELLIFPFFYSGKLKGVIELASLSKFTTNVLEWLNYISNNMGIAVNSAQSRLQMQKLLEETRNQSERLQVQQEELRQVNEELEEQQQNLKQQQEELQMTNEELEEYTQSLEAKNREVETARQEIELKKQELESTNKYKSEFLANMSHELRTPLNSLLILAQDLAENNLNNLTKEQVQSANIIHESGQDLLSLINDVLDLAKVEAGKMTINVEETLVEHLVKSMMREFKPQAELKGLTLKCDIDAEVPAYVRSDNQRLTQILRNLLSNAIKFTEKGTVSLTVRMQSDNTVAFDVTDTGIGIAAKQQSIIFEAFHQGDGGTSRKYGGTGLGLSISRELANLLHGSIRLTSKSGKGSTFTLSIPVNLDEKKMLPAPPPDLKKVPPAKEFDPGDYPLRDDDRVELNDTDNSILIIEDDERFADTLMKQARAKGFKCLSTATGEEGLELAIRYKPNAILLDMQLPGMQGSQVLSFLKSNTSLRHIPVHIFSAHITNLDPIKQGAVEHLMKPISKTQLENAFGRINHFVSRKMKNLLVLEDNANARKAMCTLIGNGDVRCIEAETGAEALNIMNNEEVDCIILDLGLPDMNGFDFIRELQKKFSKLPPIIVYTGRELTQEENNELQKYTETVIIKGVKSEERLLDETALFLHRTISKLPAAKKQMIENLYSKEAVFENKKILLVDDEQRNVFALSKVLSDRGMQIITAQNGKVALEKLKQHPDIKLVLMDIMMPEMDGYEAMKRIRKMEVFKDLCIIALTAKAMKDDKDKCLAAGANDYISKPLDVDRLLILMRVWLGK